MTNYQISIYGQVKGNITSTSLQSAVIKASFIWANGNTRGISAKIAS